MSRCPYRTMVIANPVSGGGSTGRRWPEMQDALNGVLATFEWRFTSGVGDATRLARQAILDGFEMIVSVGGDGTMQEIVTGVLAIDRDGRRLPKVERDIVIASVRQGTGGDFGRFLGLSGRVPDAVSHLAGERTRPCDLGFLTFVGPDGSPRQLGFLNATSFGMSGLADEMVNSTTKAFGGRVSFVVGIARAMLKYRSEVVRIGVDGATFYEGPLFTCVVANGQFLGGGIHIAPEAKIDDGLFDLVVLTRVGMREVASLPDIYRGRVASWDSVLTSRGQSIFAEPVDPKAIVLLDVDGEQPGRLPATMTVLPNAVRLKV